MRSFTQRLQDAIRFIERGGPCGRELDDAFENYDGDAMAAALYTLAESRPRLKANIGTYIAGLDRPEVAALIGKPLDDIAQAAAQQRAAGRAGCVDQMAGQGYLFSA